MDEDKNRLVRQQFGREADQYRNPRIHSNIEDLEFIVDFVQPESHWKVLDLATGAGNCAITFAPHVDEVIASDITPEMLEQVEKQKKEKQITNVAVEQIDVHDIPYEKHRFDLVTVRIAPHHFHDLDQAMAEIARVTKPGGRVFVEDTKAPEQKEAASWFNTIEQLRDPSHVADRSLQEWKALFETHQIEVVKTATREKEWPLDWWTNKMSTPAENKKKIIEMIDTEYKKYKNSIRIIKKDEEYVIYPKNVYILGTKQ